MSIIDIKDIDNSNITYFVIWDKEIGPTTVYAENSETGEVYCTKDYGKTWEEVWYDNDQTDRWYT